MTFRESELRMVDIAQQSLNLKWSEIHIGELGDQRIILNNKVVEYCKPYYKRKGCKHTSFDLNGLNGSISVDLSKGIDNKYHGIFDIITNAGTTEHVTDGQLECFRNIHKMIKLGGIMIHSIPAQGCWAGHCPHRYSKDFIKKLASDNGYKIILDEYTHRRKKDYLISGILQKQHDSDFVFGECAKEIDKSGDYTINSDNYK